jgi:hypothetical protein
MTDGPANHNTNLLDLLFRESLAPFAAEAVEGKTRKGRPGPSSTEMK